MIEDDINSTLKAFLKEVPVDRKIHVLKKKSTYAPELIFIKESLGITVNDICYLLNVRSQAYYDWLRGNSIPEAYNINLIEEYKAICDELSGLGCNLSILLRRHLFNGNSFIEKVRNNRINIERNDLIGLLKELILIHHREGQSKRVEEILNAPRFHGELSFKQYLSEYLTRNNYGAKFTGEECQEVLFGLIKEFRREA
jgi:transcriptional regulator with XRE-family HTH domain